MEAHSLVQELVDQGVVSHQQLKGFVKQRYGKLTKLAMTIEELEDLIRLLKLIRFSPESLRIFPFPLGCRDQRKVRVSAYGKSGF